MEFTFPAIGIIHSCFKEKFGIPRQPGLAPLATAELELLPPYNDRSALDGLEGCSHIWVQFVFHANSRNEWKPKVKPPRLGGNKSLGVFATRSPTRPAPIGLSVVKLNGIVERDGKLLLQLSGIDLLDGTPVLDIKPYVPYVDLVPAAINSFADAAPHLIPVDFNDESAAFCSDYRQKTQIDLTSLIRQILQQDPRPQYQQPEPERIYGMKLLDLDVRWQYPSTQAELRILVCGIDPIAPM
jgi:tRNA-Thr(GGU) m(6)t(6)A37 methyltransferase TsaA